MNELNKNEQTTANTTPSMPVKKQSMVSLVLGSKSRSKKDKKEMMKARKTVQDTIPYVGIYPHGVIEVRPGVFSKSYYIEDVNFKIATQDEQMNIFSRFGELLNSFGSEVKLEVTIFNRSIDIQRYCDAILMKPRNDGLDEYREESNHIVVEKMKEGRNNLAHEKYLTATIEADDIDLATTTFTRLDTEISAAIKNINGMDTPPLTTIERLSILYDIYNPDAGTSFYQTAVFDDKPVESFSLESMKKMGLTTKDAIGPSSITVKKDYLMVGDMYTRTLFLDNLPTVLSTDFLTDIAEVSCNMLLSVHFNSLHQDKAVKLIKSQIININSNVIEAQKRASKNGYSVNLISPELSKAQDEAQKLMEDITSRNQKMFLMTCVCTVFGKTLDEINENVDAITTIASKYLCSLKKLGYQQEAGMAAALPIGNNTLELDRLLTTESASLFIPFSTQELAQANGMYYGLNAVSHNLILYNRKNSKNANGVVLGTPGSGKSFSCKREIINVLLSTDDFVYIIDPEREYSPLANLFGGEVVRIAAGSQNYINPLDMDIRYADDDDPIVMKSDFIGSLCETVVGGRYGLSPIQKSVIDRCVRLVYQPYLEYLSKRKGVYFDRENSPTLVDFYNMLLRQTEPEAKNIALALELYTKGSLDTFAHRTNVNTSKRFVIYDIKDIGTQMKEMGLQVCLNDIWNKTITNGKQNQRTWFYIDEFYLLTQTDVSAIFLQQIYKRARKWGGIPTGITQNVSDMLARKEAVSIISNCDFIMMLNQAPVDRITLGNMLGISPTQMSHITNSEAGEGLLYTGSKAIVPFVDKYPMDTKTFKAMDTKFHDNEED